ncbi:hypothetical protein C5S30_00150 [ANME-1 cluster archaeon GoMg4]|nr:hypothetical protein [ANME-1 cluster archaeon GoMg4]
MDESERKFCIPLRNYAICHIRIGSSSTRKRKGTEIRKIGNNSYLYKVASVRDKEKKRAKKITEKVLGTITRDGLIEPRQERVMKSQNNIAVKEFGATNFLLDMNDDIKERFKEIYPDK